MSTAFVLDCSMTMAWCFEDECTPALIGVQDRLSRHGAVVPSLWKLEVVNVLSIAERKGRITPEKGDRFLELLERLQIEVDAEAEPRAFEHLRALCRNEGVTSYDAAYLDVARRRGLPIATLDDRLRKVAKKVGIGLVG